MKYVLGSVKQGTKQPSALVTIVDQEGKLAFYAMNEPWSGSPEMVPSGFPVTEDLAISNMPQCIMST